MWVSLLVAAVTPGFSLLTYFYLKDRYDAEPVRKVLKLFAIGLLLVFPTMFLQRGFVLSFGEHPFLFSFVISGGDRGISEMVRHLFHDLSSVVLQRTV